MRIVTGNAAKFATTQFEAPAVLYLSDVTDCLCPAIVTDTGVSNHDRPDIFVVLPWPEIEFRSQWTPNPRYALKMTLVTDALAEFRRQA